MTTPNEGPFVRTTGKRMWQGLAIIVGVMAVGAAIAVPNWHNFAKNPPPVSAIATGSPTAATGGSTGSAPLASAVPGVTTISISAGASVQGNPNFVPNSAQVPMGNKIVWVNKDTVPHTATSGTGASDPTSGKIFDTKIITNGQSSPPQVLKGVKVGESIPYYCQIHPYMTAKITVTAASSSSSSTSSNSSRSAAGKRSRRCHRYLASCKELLLKETLHTLLPHSQLRKAIPSRLPTRTPFHIRPQMAKTQAIPLRVSFSTQV